MGINHTVTFGTTAGVLFDADHRPLEVQLIDAGYPVICGVDEAGRGPLAGPVVAAAVIYVDCGALHAACDSKSISPAMREECYGRIVNELSVGVGVATAEEIDRLNILRASMLAWRRAVDNLGIANISIVLVDGNYALPGDLPSRAIIEGDARVAVIGAASIVAKVIRDRMMVEYAAAYPKYGFDRHMGYPTPEHRRVLTEIGPCPIHRRTFRGVREFYSDGAPAPAQAPAAQ